MALEISRIEVERGETVRYRLTVKNTDGSAKDLTNAEITWNLIDLVGARVFTPDRTVVNGGVTFFGPASDGRPVAEADKTETEVLSGNDAYVQEWMIIDAVGDRKIYRGSVLVNVAALPAVAA